MNDSIEEMLITLQSALLIISEDYLQQLAAMMSEFGMRKRWRERTLQTGLAVIFDCLERGEKSYNIFTNFSAFSIAVQIFM